METLKQKSILIKKEFTFRENGIEIQTKDHEGDFSVFIKFDRILPRQYIRTHTKSKRIVLRVGLLLALLTFSRGLLTSKADTTSTLAVVLAAAIVAGSTLGYFFVTRVKYYLIDLEDNKCFFVLVNKPNSITVNNFIDEIFERRRKYFRVNFFQIDFDNTRTSEIEKMKWLKSEEIITQSEFEVVVEEINETLED